MGGGAAPTKSLIISELARKSESNSSNPSAIEVFNPTGDSYDLSKCSVKLTKFTGKDGKNKNEYDYSLSGTLNSGSAHLLCSKQSISEHCNISNMQELNKRSSVQLICDNVVIDFIGDNMNSEKVSGSTYSVRRNCGILKGNKAGFSGKYADNLEWSEISDATKVFENLGTHKAVCDAPAE